MAATPWTGWRPSSSGWSRTVDRTSQNDTVFGRRGVTSGSRRYEPTGLPAASPDTAAVRRSTSARVHSFAVR